MADRPKEEQNRTDDPNRKGQPDQRHPDKSKQKPEEGPMGDSALTEEAAKDPDIDRSKTPGRAYDV